MAYIVNGSGHYGSLIQGSDGNFYGTTFGGGLAGRVTVFKLIPKPTKPWTLVTIVDFANTVLQIHKLEL